MNFHNHFHDHRSTKNPLYPNSPSSYKSQARKSHPDIPALTTNPRHFMESASRSLPTCFKHLEHPWTERPQVCCLDDPTLNSFPRENMENTAHGSSGGCPSRKAKGQGEILASLPNYFHFFPKLWLEAKPSQEPFHSHREIHSSHHLSARSPWNSRESSWQPRSAPGGQFPFSRGPKLRDANNCSVNDPLFGPRRHGREALPHVWSSHFLTSGSNPIPVPAAGIPVTSYLGKGTRKPELPSEFPPQLFPLAPNSSFVPNPSLQTRRFSLCPSFLHLCPLLGVEKLIKINKL